MRAFKEADEGRHHGSPTTSNQRFPPFECVPRGIGHRAVVGIAPSSTERMRAWTTLRTTLSAHVGMCAQYRMLYLTTLLGGKSWMDEP
jgi:hypothetical protein